MKGTTRCPYCNTRFKITEAQLTAHQGMVRCGHCHQAFDAVPHFTPDLTETAVYAEPPETAEHAEPENKAVEAPIEIPPVPAQTVAETPTESPAAESSAAGDMQAADAAKPGEDAPPSADSQLSGENLGGKNDDSTILQPTHNAIVLDETIAQNLSPSDSSAFLTDQKTAFDVKGRRWPWISGIALSVVLLLAQSAYFFRVGLAVHLPALKPALVAYCRLLSCTVPLPRDPALISIESSDLDADTLHDNLITLNALLRNRAAYPQGFPMLSLTLNDSHDKPLARRLFQPSEYLPQDESELSGFAANHEISVKLHLDISDLKASGYRLELFYTPG